MASCSRVAGCPLFKHFSIKASLLVWTRSYCEGGFARCERLKLADAGLPVPPNLLPNGKLLAVSLDRAGPSDAGAI
jgi:hypothetical protein